ncbi:hypothetical protein U0070_009773 [Myodes glareolus]|uniref:glyceraldehyde-3-phosphate dehydrogenase (phosphorylating) n=1 Tax=Myodes glareolus TaxID=447135 RepID=A0AAW0JGD0_MYOGA
MGDSHIFLCSGSLVPETTVKARANGFGHIEHLVTKAAFISGKVDIVAINNCFIDHNYMVYMCQDDSIHGKLNGTVNTEDGNLVINGTTITIFQDPRTLGQVTHDNLGIVEELMPIAHAVAATQKTVDAPSRKLWFDSHRTAQKIIPASAGTAKDVGKVTPELDGKLLGMAFHIPTPSVSIVDMICCLEKASEYDDIKKVVKQASKCPLKSILGYTEDQVVSCGFNSDVHSSTFDAGAGIVLNDVVKLISWYDSEYGYSNRVIAFACP